MINLVFKGTHAGAQKYKLEYGKDDGINAVQFSIVSPYPTSLPYTVLNVPEGKYICKITPVMPDGSLCPTQEYVTSDCKILSVFLLTREGDNLVISANATGVTKLNIIVTYPDNTLYNQLVSLPGPFNVPTNGQFGSFQVKARAVCNETENFYGPFRSGVVTILESDIPVYWNAQDSNVLPTENEILAWADHSSFSYGSTITIPFYNFNNSPKYLVFAEPATEPAKTIYYFSQDEKGSLGPDGPWANGVVVGNFRVYMGNYATQTGSLAAQFKVS